MDFQEDEEGERMFKVKWYNFPNEAATMEPEKNIPKFTVEIIMTTQNYEKFFQAQGLSIPRRHL
jgi:hypothetical protein